MSCQYQLAPTASNDLTYWNYLQLDGLLALQRPRTDSRDEKPFIILHQIAELGFALIIHELEQLTNADRADPQQWKIHLRRVVQYFRFLTMQLGLTARGIAKEEFANFRNALFPASGFQSFQFRKIELLSARLYDLTLSHDRNPCSYSTPVDDLLPFLYWRRVGGEHPNLTLANFEERYLVELTDLARHCEGRNLAERWDTSPSLRNDPSIAELLRRYDRLANVTWPELHYRLAVAFLEDKRSDQASSGGTDWRRYLRAKQTHISFFPELCTQDTVSRRSVTVSRPKIIKRLK